MPELVRGPVDHAPELTIAPEDEWDDADRRALAALTEEDLARADAIMVEVVAEVEQRARARALGLPILSQERFLRRYRRRHGPR